jgi:hypothetical protein
MYSSVNRIFNFSYFDRDYPTYRLTITRLARVYCITFFIVKKKCKYFVHSAAVHIRKLLFVESKFHRHLSAACFVVADRPPDGRSDVLHSHALLYWEHGAVAVGLLGSLFVAMSTNGSYFHTSREPG